MVTQLQRSNDGKLQADKVKQLCPFNSSSRQVDRNSLSCLHFYNLEQSTRTVAQVGDDRARTLERQERSGQECRRDHGSGHGWAHKPTMGELGYMPLEAS